MQENNFSVRATGNGHIIAYHHNFDIIQFFGPPYSSPSVGSIDVNGECDVYDFTICDKPVFVREVTGNNCIHTFRFPENIVLKEITYRYDGYDVIVYQAIIKSGTYVYFYYPLNKPLYYNIVFKSSNKDSVVLEGNTLRFNACGSFAIIGGERYPDIVLNTEFYLQCNIEYEKERTVNRKAEYFNLLPSYNLPLDLPERDNLLKAIEGTITALITQQDKEGGVIAGYPYHLGYVRDQFGVVKGMLKLGMVDEAFRILYYFLNVFKREGRINNAEGLGLPGILHVHENDDVEITGYIVLMFFDCYNSLNDEEAKRRIFVEFMPLLSWALTVQADQVIYGMLPFNGDETYIAGGILPRNAIFDGSSEATVLFIDSATRFIDEINRIAYDYDVTYIQKKLNECINLFKENFIQDGKLITNNPERTFKGDIPRFRHGVCEGYCGFFGWNERSKSGLYLCNDCLKHEEEFVNNRKIYALKSVLLLPLFISSSFIKVSDIIDEIYEISKDYLNSGSLPSVQGGVRNLGYDFGFLLNALNKVLKHIDKKDERIFVFAKTAFALYKDTLDLVDKTYTWCEYYDNKKCAGTQFRPWESAINIRSLIEFAEIYDEIKVLL